WSRLLPGSHQLRAALVAASQRCAVDGEAAPQINGVSRDGSVAYQTLVVSSLTGFSIAAGLPRCMSWSLTGWVGWESPTPLHATSAANTASLTFTMTSIIGRPLTPEVVRPSSRYFKAEIRPRLQNGGK